MWDSSVGVVTRLGVSAKYFLPSQSVQPVVGPSLLPVQWVSARGDRGMKLSRLRTRGAMPLLPTCHYDVHMDSFKFRL
jgi:hypothetical protein